MLLNVQEFGAKGDGTRDDTAAIQKALDTAAETTSIVDLPAGKYLVEGTLRFPAGVTLRGVFRAPPTTIGKADGWQPNGSVLLAVAGKDEPDGHPFILMHESTTLEGVTVYYPEQTMTNPPIPYPWTVRGVGHNVSIVNCLLVNPYQALDFGSCRSGRHYVRGLSAQPLYRGIYVDQCYDIGKIEDVHFWPFWGTRHGLKEFQVENAEAFVIGRTDWEYMFNCFCIFYKVGYHFLKRDPIDGNVLLTQCGSDIGPLAVLAEGSQVNAGISFVNGQIMSGVEVRPGVLGPVKFTACGFWGTGETDYHALLEGDNQVTFTGCHFVNWAETNPQSPAIIARSGGLVVNGCDFRHENKAQIRLEKGVESATVFGNRLRGGARIENHSEGSIEIGLNSTR